MHPQDTFAGTFVGAWVVIGHCVWGCVVCVRLVMWCLCLFYIRLKRYLEDSKAAVAPPTFIPARIKSVRFLFLFSKHLYIRKDKGERSGTLKMCCRHMTECTILSRPLVLLHHRKKKGNTKCKVIKENGMKQSHHNGSIYSLMKTEEEGEKTKKKNRSN